VPLTIAFHNKGQFDLFELKILLEYDEFWSKYRLHMSFELVGKHLNSQMCLLPCLPSLTILFGPCDGLLQNGLCFFYQNWCQLSKNLGDIYNLLTTFGRGTTVRRPYVQKVLTTPKFHKTQ
jgi:hypothetical protein